ncbi:sensor histidine kinase [Dyella humicola]|uniref:sensor histidine kinase n=1 Tax=Dyella humicola TaxID=2992126 RepID=UPI00225629B2|nr:ATP-binding protein [Dyella humicola]
MWQRLKAWLRRVPISDPVDRRNAVFMQLLLAYQGLRTPLIKIYLLASEWQYMTTAFFEKAAMGKGVSIAVDLGTDLAITVAAWLGVYLIRIGRFRQAVKQFLATQLISGLVAFAAFGYKVTPGDALLIMSLALGGLMLGRRALWTIYVSILVILAAGMTTDYLNGTGDAKTIFSAYHHLLFHTFGYALIAIILDRSIGALREALAESEMRGQKLQLEMLERERTQEQLLHSQKMDAIGQLAQGIAHDFNNVLGIVLGFARERHRLDEPEAERGVDAVALAHALLGVELAARRADSISRKLLNFSRRDTTQVETFDVVEAVQDLQSMLRQMFPSSVHLAIQANEAPLYIEFDLSQFELAILNIASNARDAMPEGGLFEVIVAPSDAATVSLTLRDNGIGMAEEMKKRIFEPFFTTKPVGSGTGIGLTVVYNLIRAAGGSIEVESQPGIGTAFRIQLPVARVPEQEMIFMALKAGIQVNNIGVTTAWTTAQ